MSNLWLNIAFGIYHLQIGKEGIRFSKNIFWGDNKPPKWFRVYQIGNWHG